MRVALLVAAAVAACASASTVTFVSPLPASISLQQGEPITVGLDKINSALLGLSTLNGQPVEKSLFAPTRAIVSVEVNGISAEIPVEGAKVPLRAAPVAHWDKSVQEAIDAQFDAADFEVVHVHGKTVRASDAAMKKAIEEEKVDTTKLKSAKGDHSDALKNALRLAATIVDRAEQLNSHTGPALFRVQLSGAAPAADVQLVLQKLAAAARSVYGEEAVVVQFVQWEEKKEEHKREKRDAPTGNAVMDARKKLHVTVFASSDYPAIFAIFAGLVIILALAILYIAVGLWNLDPGKDSIIYRMTTTRQKKD